MPLDPFSEQKVVSSEREGLENRKAQLTAKLKQQNVQNDPRVKARTELFLKEVETALAALK